MVAKTDVSGVQPFVGENYTSHELRIGFQCKGSCKGPYTLTAVSDYNAWYNETLNSFFFINATTIKTKW